MLRSLTAGAALSVLAAACALFIEPSPPGTVALPARIENRSTHEFAVTVKAGTGQIIPGAVQPTTTVPAFSTVARTLYVPVNGDGEIDIQGYGVMRLEALRAFADGPCGLMKLTIQADLSGGVQCLPVPGDGPSPDASVF